MTPLIGWLLVYVVVGQFVVVLILVKMAHLSGRDRWVVLSIPVAWPAFLAAVAAHRLWTRFGTGRSGS